MNGRGSSGSRYIRRATWCALARRWPPLVSALVAGAALTACGGSSTGSSSAPGATTPTAPVATPAGSPAAGQCPSASTVGSALGFTVNAPVVIPGGGTSLPAGATGVSCDYGGPSLNVLVQILANVTPATITQFSDKFPVAYTSVPGVGDQARSFRQALNGGKDNEGVVATKGSALVNIVATDTPASLSQIEALVSLLL